MSRNEAVKYGHTFDCRMSKKSIGRVLIMVTARDGVDSNGTYTRNSSVGVIGRVRISMQSFGYRWRMRKGAHERFGNSGAG